MSPRLNVTYPNLIIQGRGRDEHFKTKTILIGFKMKTSVGPRGFINISGPVPRAKLYTFAFRNRGSSIDVIYVNIISPLKTNLTRD